MLAPVIGILAIVGFVYFGLVGWGRQVAIFSPNFPFGNMAVPTRFDPNEWMFFGVMTQYGGLQNAADEASNDSGVRFMLTSLWPRPRPIRRAPPWLRSTRRCSRTAPTRSLPSTRSTPSKRSTHSHVAPG